MAGVNTLDLSADTLAIMQRLKEASVGETVTLDDLSGVIGRDIRRHRHLVYSALRVLLREDGMIFATVRGIGYQRVPADQAHEVGVETRRAIRRKARRSSRKIAHGISRANDLSDEALRKAHSEMATLGLMEHLARDKVQPREDDKPAAPVPVALTARRMLDRLAS